MKTHISSLLSLVLFCYSSPAAVLQESKVSEIVSSALPSYRFVDGNSNWSGGVKGNSDINNSLFDSNTAFLIVELKPGETPLTATDISETINRYIIQSFNFPTERPSSTWVKAQPSGTTKERFGETFLRTYPQNNDVKSQAMYLTIQTVKLDNSRFSVTLSYVNRER